MGGDGQLLFDVGNRRSGFVGIESAIAVWWGIGDRVLWVMRGDRCFGDEEIGDQVLWVLRGDRCLLLREKAIIHLIINFSTMSDLMDSEAFL